MPAASKPSVFMSPTTPTMVRFPATSLPARSARIGGCEHDRPSPRQLDMLTDRIAVFPIFSLERFVDHRDPLTC